MFRLHTVEDRIGIVFKSLIKFLIMAVQVDLFTCSMPCPSFPLLSSPL